MGLTALPVANYRSDASVTDKFSFFNVIGMAGLTAHHVANYRSDCVGFLFVIFLPLWDTLHILSYGGFL